MSREPQPFTKIAYLMVLHQATSPRIRKAPSVRTPSPPCFQKSKYFQKSMST